MNVHNDLVCPTVQCVHITPRNKEVSFKVCTVCVQVEPKSKEVFFNMQGIFSCVRLRYYRKEIFAKGRGPCGLENI